LGALNGCPAQRPGGPRNENGHYSAITDVRTAVPSLAGICPGAAATPGHADLLYEVAKDTKWMRQAAARGLVFHALVSEDGGRLGVGAVRFVNFLATHAGSSMGERRAFVSFALQRLRCATTVKGGCALINDRSPSGGGPSRSCRGFCLCRSPRGAQRPPGPGPYRAPTWRRRHRGMPRHSRPRRRFPNAQQCLGTPPFWVFMLYVYTSQTGSPPPGSPFCSVGVKVNFWPRGCSKSAARPPSATS
jgi:hypothetical protein